MCFFDLVSNIFLNSMHPKVLKTLRFAPLWPYSVKLTVKLHFSKIRKYNRSIIEPLFPPPDYYFTPVSVDFNSQYDGIWSKGYKSKRFLNFWVHIVKKIVWYQIEKMPKLEGCKVSITQKYIPIMGLYVTELGLLGSRSVSLLVEKFWAPIPN